MARIYIPRIQSDNFEYQSIYKRLVIKLTALKHEVLLDNIDYDKDVETKFKSLLTNSEIIIPVITRDTLNSKIFYNELIKLRNYIEHSKENKLLIPIIESDLLIAELPDILITLNLIQLESYADYSIDKAAEKIDEAINSFLGRKLATQEKEQVIKEKIENKAPAYISETLKELISRESYQKNIALFWYILGFLSIISGIVVAYTFANNGLTYFKGKENWSLTIFSSIKSLIIIVLLIAASKYCFNLAKSYMGESLKVADRIHAISFGKFYLQIFDQQLDSNEIKEIFRDWNINNQSSTFSAQNSSDYDPKIFEKIVEFVDKIKNNEK